MKTVENYALEYLSMSRPIGITIEDYTVIQACVDATRYYAAHTGLRANDYRPADDVTKDTEISISEWGLIRPLFVMYVDREVAISLEASRTFGVESYGRQVSEIEADIRDYQEGIKRAAFSQPVMGGEPSPIVRTPSGSAAFQIDRFGFIIK